MAMSYESQSCVCIILSSFYVKKNVDFTTCRLLVRGLLTSLSTNQEPNVSSDTRHCQIEEENTINALFQRNFTHVRPGSKILRMIDLHIAVPVRVGGIRRLRARIIYKFLISPGPSISPRLYRYCPGLEPWIVDWRRCNCSMLAVRCSCSVVRRGASAVA
jgi:hypothetical protein